MFLSHAINGYTTPCSSFSASSLSVPAMASIEGLLYNKSTLQINRLVLASWQHRSLQYFLPASVQEKLCSWSMSSSLYGSVSLSDLYQMEVSLIMGERDHATSYADSFNRRTHPPYPVHRRLRGPQNLSGRR